MKRWEGKVALVTGASAGIGAAIVEELVKHGMKVIGLARRVEKVEEIKTKLGSGLKGELYPLKGDVSKEEDILQTFEWIQKKFGTIHVLVNNAGIACFGTTLEAPTQLFRKVIDTNLLGLTIVTHKALNLMKEAGVDDGHIININSTCGHYVPNTGNPQSNVYAATKFGVTAITDTLRQDFIFAKTNTRVTSISPGAVRTEFPEAKAKGTGRPLTVDERKYYDGLPKLEAEDVANSVIYVLSAPQRVQIHEIIMKPTGEPF